jgi:hypothetical protein
VLAGRNRREFTGLSPSNRKRPANTPLSRSRRSSTIVSTSIS